MFAESEVGRSRFEEVSMNDTRRSPRHAITEEKFCSLGLITLKDRGWADHVVRLRDMSESGVGIESEQALDRGLVWFHDRVAGHKGGVLVWCKKIEERYRAGIHFVPLSREEERQVQERTLQSGHQAHRSPDEIIEALMTSLQKDPPGIM
jgi:hypothetical protein